MTGYPLDQLFEEVAYIAFHLHWPHHEIMSMEHGDRRQWVEEVARINRRLNDDASTRSAESWYRASV